MTTVLKPSPNCKPEKPGEEYGMVWPYISAGRPSILVQMCTHARWPSDTARAVGLCDVRARSFGD